MGRMLSIINDTISSSFLQGTGGSRLPWIALKDGPCSPHVHSNKLCLAPWDSAPSHSLAGLWPGTHLYQDGVGFQAAACSVAQEVDGPRHLFSAREGKPKGCRGEAEVM